MTVESSPGVAGPAAPPKLALLDFSLATYRRTRSLCHFVIFFLGRVDIQGSENIPAAGPVILASNHRAHVDPPYLSKLTDRPLMFMAKEELFANPKFGAFLQRLGAFPVRRGEADRGALKHAIGLLKTGQLLAIFPEGTRAFDRTLLPAEKGFALIAKQTGAPIVPVALEGTERILPKGTLFLHRGRVTITVGKPVTAKEILAAHDGDSGKDALEIIGRDVMSRIAALRRTE